MSRATVAQVPLGPPFGRILPSWTGGVNVGFWPTADVEPSWGARLLAATKRKSQEGGSRLGHRPGLPLRARWRLTRAVCDVERRRWNYRDRRREGLGIIHKDLSPSAALGRQRFAGWRAPARFSESCGLRWVATGSACDSGAVSCDAIATTGRSGDAPGCWLARCLTARGVKPNGHAAGGARSMSSGARMPVAVT